MTDRLDAIEAGLRDGRYDWPGDSEDVRWLVGEIKWLRQRLEDVNIKDAAKTAEINILTAENRKLCERKAWYGDYLALRERHAAAEADTQQVAMLKTLLAEAREARDIWFQRYTVAAERLTFAEAELRALRPTT